MPITLYDAQVTQEYTRIWRSLSADSLELIEARYVTYAFPRHMHDTFVFCVIESGAELLRWAGHNATAGPGQILCINPGVVHSGEAATKDGYAYRGIYPTAELGAKVAQEMTGKSWTPDFAHPVVDDPSLAKGLSQVISKIKATGDSLETESLVRAWLAKLIERHPAHRLDTISIGAECQSVDRAREFIHAYFTDPISLGDISKAAGLSPYHLGRVFADQVGLPLHAYCVNLRINHAKRLLRSGRPIAEAAVESGFTDQSHLNKWFKRLVGLTPGQYA